MPNSNGQISNIKIKQIFLLAVIIGSLWVIITNLSDFIPSFLGASTLYIICRNYYFTLIEKRKWKSWLAALFIILLTIIIILIPAYFVGDALVSRLINASEYVPKFHNFIEQIHNYINKELGVDVLSSKNVEKLGEILARYSSAAVNTTVNIVVGIASAYLILYFMLINAREFENVLINSFPLKKSNVNRIGEKIRKMVIANAVGIPVVAVVQGFSSIIGYLIFNAPDPWFLFALTCVGSMLPVVGAAIVYVPVGIFMMATGNVFGGVGVLLYGFIVIGTVDNVFRFAFLKKLENIHPLNTIFGIILGLNVFGFMGLIFGPIIISLTVLLIKVYKNEFFGDQDNIFYKENDDPENNLENKD